MWATGAKKESLEFLRHFSASLSRDLQVETSDNSSYIGIPKEKLAELSKLLARCYFKMGEWQFEFADDWGAVRSFTRFTTIQSNQVRYSQMLGTS